MFAAAGFAGPEHLTVPAGQVWDRTEDDVVDSVFSLSSAAPHLFGDGLANFEADLRELLRGTAPDGRFSERAPDASLDPYRPVDS